MAATPRNGGSQTESARGGTPEASRSAGAAGGTESRQQQSVQSGKPVAKRGTSGGLAPRFMQNPASLMLQLHREMDRLMDSFFSRSFDFGPEGFFGSALRPSFGDGGEIPSLWTPRVDVRQRGDSIVVCADLPGVRKEDITIEATEDGIAISGERREEREESDEQQGYRFAERSYGKFYRTVPLPEGANVEEAKATMRDGVLEVTIPAPSQKRRQIRIEA